MLYWLFTTYREIAIFTGLPFLCGGVIAPLIAAYLLGTGGQKSLQSDGTDKTSPVVTIPSILAALAAMHLGVLLLGNLAIDREIPKGSSAIAAVLIAPPGFSYFRLILSGALVIALGVGASFGVRHLVVDGGWLREQVNRMRDPARRREELGSAHFCYPGEFARLARPKEGGLTLLGAFYGKRGRGGVADDFRRLDVGSNRIKDGRGITLSLEDQARGIVTIGPPGTGKSQAVILPVVADSMALHQSIILADPQGELTDHVLDFARVTGHQVIVHDPTSTEHPRYNLADEVTNVSEAQAVARVLVPTALNNDFWQKSAQNLLAACLLRFNSLGDILLQLSDLTALAEKLEAQQDGAAYLSRSFTASLGADGRVAASVVATLQASTLSAWADETVRYATESTDFSASMLVEHPVVLILRCPGRYRDVYGAYFGAILQKLMIDLDMIGEKADGPLPRPIKIVLEEFPVLGRLDGVVTSVNLFRKRHISFLIAAQSMSQFELIYGRAASETLLGGLATQIYFGGGDGATAKFVSDSLGITTEHVPSPREGVPPQSRQRHLLNQEEVVSPPRGNCTIIYRYATATYATQIVTIAQLTRMYEREDWKREIAQAKTAGREPSVMERPLFEQPTGNIKIAPKHPTDLAKDTFIRHKEPTLPSLGEY